MTRNVIRLCSARQKNLKNLDRDLDIIILPGLIGGKGGSDRCPHCPPAGTRVGGLNCFMINTDAREITSDGGVRDALMELHLGFEQAHDLLKDCYVEWDIIDQSKRAWRVPESRHGEEFTLASTCLQFLARKTGGRPPDSDQPT